MSTVDIHTDDANGREKRDPWRGFSFGRWRREIDIRGFIQENYSPYDGDESFLSEPTSDTQILWEQVQELLSQERERGGSSWLRRNFVAHIIFLIPFELCQTN